MKPIDILLQSAFITILILIVGFWLYRRYSSRWSLRSLGLFTPEVVNTPMYGRFETLAKTEPDLDAFSAIITFALVVSYQMLHYEIPPETPYTLDEVMNKQFIMWVKDYGEKYYITNPEIVTGSPQVYMNGKYEHVHHHSAVKIRIDMAKYDLPMAEKDKYFVIDFVYPYFTTYTDLAKSGFTVTHELARHMYNHVLDSKGFDIICNYILDPNVPAIS